MAPKIPDKTAAEMRLDAKREALKREINELMERIHTNGATETGIVPDTRISTKVRPIRRHNMRFHYAANEPNFDGRALEIMAQIQPLFDMVAWLRTVAKPGERITVSEQW